MKKLITTIILAASGLFTLHAQENKTTNYDALLAPWFMEGNFRMGTLNQGLTQSNWTSSYINPLNANLNNLNASNGSGLGFDFQLGYFFGKNRHFGLGSGILFLSQKNNLEMSSYHIEYQSADSKGAIFRQSITANSSLSESVKTSNLSLPILLKFKKQFNSKWGINLDAGILINLKTTSTYTNNSKINYEAIYKFDDAGNPIYDNSPVADPNDWLITKQHYEDVNSDGNVNVYFEDLYAKGYNVGLGVSPTKTSGDAAKQTISIGFLVQPSVSYMLRKNLALQGSFYYLSYNAENTATANYRLTDTRGDYSSITNGISKTTNQSVGFAIGLRYYFGEPKPKVKDKDGDGVLDKDDNCPDIAGLKQFGGCPDSDGDGITDALDKCPQVAGLKTLNGCPDSDGDGISDPEDKCPQVAGLKTLNGCPDSDGDGVTDSEDKCPQVAGLAALNGCPEPIADINADKVATTVIMVDEKYGKPVSGNIIIRKEIVEVFTGKSNTSGVSNFYLLPGIYQVSVSAAGYLPQIETLDLSQQVKGSKYEIKLKPVKLEKGLVFKFKLVNFETGSNNLTPDSYQMLDKMAEIMLDNPKMIVEVAGFTDNVGDDKANKVLSEKRAQTVVDYLRNKGVKTQQMKSIGYGEERPIASNDTEEGRLQNRRVMFTVLEY